MLDFCRLVLGQRGIGHWVDFSQSGPPNVLVNPDANDWSSRMQMCGQVECNYPFDGAYILNRYEKIPVGMATRYS